MIGFLILPIGEDCTDYLQGWTNSRKITITASKAGIRQTISEVKKITEIKKSQMKSKK